MHTFKNICVCRSKIFKSLTDLLFILVVNLLSYIISVVYKKIVLKFKFKNVFIYSWFITRIDPVLSLSVLRFKTAGGVIIITQV